MKQGVIKEWKCNPLFFELYLQTERSLERIKFFYPFGVENHGDGIDEKRELYLDYRLETFKRKIGVDVETDGVSNISHHKFLNTIVSIIEP